jgi:phosphotransferase system enzyme I (PtsI)
MSSTSSPAPASETVLQGIGVSPGVVMGPALLLVHEAHAVVERRLAEEETGSEIARLERALIETRSQIRGLQRDLEARAASSDASVFDAHLLVLDDRSLMEEIVADIRTSRRNAEAAVRDVCERYSAALASVDDEYLRERVADIRDVTRRLIRNLIGAVRSPLADVPSGSIVVAADLSPSETAAMRKEHVLGFATDGGSATSHTALMARALEIPAVVGLHDITARVTAGDEVLIDGNKGVIVIRPSPERLEEYGRVAEERRKIQHDLTRLREEPAETRDGRRITLSANAEGVEDIEAVLAYGAQGIGLLRSEYLYLSSKMPVGEEEQAKVYGEIASRLAPAPVIIRTLDIGGDKYLPDGQSFHEANPFLGCRSIRLSLLYPEQFKAQLRAILRAGTAGNVKLMYPMVSNVEEVTQANALLEEAKQELAGRGVPFAGDIEVGVMIEIPSAALIADDLAQHVRFFSLGTNDLVQYCLAVDRINERVAYLYQPTHPAVLKLISRTVEAGHRKGIWVGVCGEMGADPLMTPLLVGMGVDELSVAPSAVPLVKDAIRSMDYAAAREMAAACLNLSSAVAVRQRCVDEMRRIAPELLELV